MTPNFGTHQQNGSTCWGKAMQMQESFMDSRVCDGSCNGRLALPYL